MGLASVENLVRKIELVACKNRGIDEAMQRDSRREQGAFFTPYPLVDFVVSETLRSWHSSKSQSRETIKVLDPACGDGRFLVTAYGHAIATDKNIRPELLGFERDGGFANAARKAIGENGLVSEIEALTESPKKLEGTIDVVVGNPPYLRSVALAKSDPELWNALKGAYLATSHGEWDLYGAFLEHKLRWLSPEGEAGMIIPSRWLTARNTSRLRKSLGTRGLVRGVVDFGATQVFPGATA